LKAVIAVDTYEESLAIPKPRRRWLKRVGCGLLVVLVPALILLTLAIPNWVWRHHVVQQRLDEALADLDRADPGWRLEDVEAGRQQVPEEENSARIVSAAAQQLPRDWQSNELGDLLAHLAPEEQLFPADFARLEQELDRVRPALDEARKLANMPRGRHRLSYQRNILNTLLKDQAEARRIVWLLVCDAMRYDQKGDIVNAMISCRAAFNAARSLGDEPLALSQLIRNAAVISVCRAIERALAQGEPAPEDLVALAPLFVIEDAFPDLLITARGERAGDQALFDAIESGDVSMAELADGRPGWHERLFGFFYRENVRAEHPTMLALMSKWVAIARLPMPEQADAEQRFNREINALPEAAILTRLLLPHLTKLGEASRRKHAYLRCTIVAFAAEQFRRKHGTWPDTIDKLYPNYLSDGLEDPFDGVELRYRLTEDGLVIYSVGQDKTDNNGNLDREHLNQSGVDIGVRLWDVAKRRQPPQPKPRDEE
jgi:hypothetical protein